VGAGANCPAGSPGGLCVQLDWGVCPGETAGGGAESTTCAWAWPRSAGGSCAGAGCQTTWESGLASVGWVGAGVETVCWAFWAGSADGFSGAAKVANDPDIDHIALLAGRVAPHWVLASLVSPQGAANGLFRFVQ
jgi:hypothetical protein